MDDTGNCPAKQAITSATGGWVSAISSLWEIDEINRRTDSAIGDAVAKLTDAIAAVAMVQAQFRELGR